ncbi:MAG: hypothetical protein SPG07_08295 [Coriobacteriales bacterium]|nr:hypothetical protein [Coriobacteriales bacterium]
MRQKTTQQAAGKRRPIVGLLSVLGAVVAFLLFLALVTAGIHFAML